MSGPFPSEGSPAAVTAHAPASSAPPAVVVEPGLQADQRLLDRGWLRIGAGLAVAGQAMVFSLAVNVSEIDGWSYVTVHGILIFAALSTLALIGRDLVKSAVDSLVERKVTIDLLFLVTLLGALIGSLVSTFTRTGSVYYEVVAILIVVHTAGKMLGARSRVAALSAVTSTREKFDQCDVLDAAGRRVRRSVRELEPGAIVCVGPGEAIAVDGRIRSGAGYVQETAMTGEWKPVARFAGERVLAGTFSVDGSFEIEAEGGDRKLDTILNEVERARVAPSALQAQSDRLMRWFLPLVVGASALTFAGWFYVAPWERALFNAMAVLLVACPCAMGLATPVAVWGGLARLAQRGVIARTGDFLDLFARTDVVCLDKTGTLSADTLVVREWRVEPGFAEREGWLRQVVAAAEAGIHHPVAAALRADAASAAGGEPVADPVRVFNRRIVPGQGVVAQTSMENGAVAEVRIGERSLAFLSTGTRALPRDEPAKLVHVFVEGVPAAQIPLSECWREGLVETLQRFDRLGLKTEILSGDPQAVETLREALPVLGANTVVRAGMSPADKKTRIDQHREGGRVVAFVGDGINDASALSAADVSIAVTSGTDLARASSMAVLVGNDLRVIPDAIVTGRDVRRSIRTNLWFAASYNILGMLLAAAGLLHPVAAALLMLGSSLFVSVRALRSTAGPASG